MLGKIEELNAIFSTQGYFTLDKNPAKSVAETMYELAEHIGGKIMPGRGGKFFEKLRILKKSEAHAYSLSSISGTGAQPWHVDGSHLTIPPRYLIFGCNSDVTKNAPTTQILKISLEALSRAKFYRESFTIRNGRASFYSTIANVDRPWIRFDPGCMSAQTEIGCALLKTFDSISAESVNNVEWTAGKILVIDNWAVVHRRGPISDFGNRSLFRLSLSK